MSVPGFYQLPRVFPPFYIPVGYANYTEDPAGGGCGNFGVIKKLDSNDGSPSIAIKKLTNPFANKDRAKQVLRELLLVNSLHHPHVVRMLGKYTLDRDAQQMESIYHITAHCGVPLDKIIDFGKYKMDHVKKWTRELLSALQYVHSIGITHRNIQPKKMCINTPHDRLTLLGFGMARVIDKNSINTNKTGQDHYMALELRYEWDGAYCEKVDIWSMAAILCEMITGAVLFSDPKNVIKRIIEYCGPVEQPEREQMTDRLYREAVASASIGAERKYFPAILHEQMKGGRTIGVHDIDRERMLGDFIDRTLQFRASLRMTADQAIRHPFLSGSDVPYEQGLPENDADALRRCREYIWEEVKPQPPQP